MSSPDVIARRCQLTNGASFGGLTVPFAIGLAAVLFDGLAATLNGRTWTGRPRFGALHQPKSWVRGQAGKVVRGQEMQDHGEMEMIKHHLHEMGLKLRTNGF